MLYAQQCDSNNGNLYANLLFNFFPLQLCFGCECERRWLTDPTCAVVCDIARRVAWYIQARAWREGHQLAMNLVAERIRASREPVLTVLVNRGIATPSSYYEPYRMHIIRLTMGFEELTSLSWGGNCWSSCRTRYRSPALFTYGTLSSGICEK